MAREAVRIRLCGPILQSMLQPSGRNIHPHIHVCTCVGRKDSFQTLLFVRTYAHVVCYANALCNVLYTYQTLHHMHHLYRYGLDIVALTT